MKESFGEKLKRARTQSGLKQSELAKTLGVKNTTISNWENNISKPDLDMLSYICGVLNVKASFFLEAHPPIEDIDCSEYEIIEKYRFISTQSPDGASVVDTVLDREYAIAAQLKEQSEYIKKLELLNSSNDFADPYADIPDTLEELEKQQHESSLPDIEHHAG